MTVIVNGNLDIALRTLRKKIAFEGIVQDLARHNEPKPSQRRRQRHDRAVRRRKKLGIN